MVIICLHVVWGAYGAVNIELLGFAHWVAFMNQALMHLWDSSIHGLQAHHTNHVFMN